ncbi:2-oxoglutarate and iron-dependent oxygenase domain-containing protein [Neochlamydia sp. EPS4]|uniref:2OG-Fe(II) oxygenase family protein n=1 Tax=Neochlamydia sp. EPS4 TaxID=1478175 RepID=UPI0006940278|nr:2-oxoglutarate and iron-dependent oxygenase domain-containing protein [Neochlamydia sp. EPS4]
MNSPIHLQGDASTIPPVDLPHSSLVVQNVAEESSLTDSLAKKSEADELLDSRLVVNTEVLIDDAPISLFDLRIFEQAQGEKRRELIKQFGDGLKNIGFVAFKVEALQPLIEAAYFEMEKYFNQPLEDKMKDCQEDPSIGFSPQGRETAAGAYHPDLKETFSIPPNFKEWPANRLKFQEIMSLYHQQFTKLAALFMGYLAEYLNEPPENILIPAMSGNHLLRLAHYPAPKAEDDPQAVWASAHEDLNVLTLLPSAKVPGLQVMTKEGEWKYVNIPKGYILINTGEQLYYKSAGLIRAPRHQVINPGGLYARQRRFASLFFLSWPANFSLIPFAGCLNQVMADMPEGEKEEYIKNFPEMTVQECLEARLIEMRIILEPSEELVKTLSQKGLLKMPPHELIALYPSIFSEEQKGT